VKIDIFLALHDQSHALVSLTRLPKSSKRKKEEEGLEGKFGPRLRFPVISASMQLVPGPSRLSSVPNLEYDAAFENVSGPR